MINNDATELHRAKKIKEAGFNAIRSAHHPMSRSLMKACDQVGLYVMDEAFDFWYRPKGGNPYCGRFPDCFREDTAAMVFACPGSAQCHPGRIKLRRLRAPKPCIRHSKLQNGGSGFCFESLMALLRFRFS